MSVHSQFHDQTTIDLLDLAIDPRLVTCITVTNVCVCARSADLAGSPEPELKLHVNIIQS